MWIKPDSWTKIDDHVYRHPNGLLLRGVSSYDELYLLGGVAIQLSNGLMYGVFGRDMLNELAAYGKDVHEWAMARVTKFLPNYSSVPGPDLTPSTFGTTGFVAADPHSAATVYRLVQSDANYGYANGPLVAPTLVAVFGVPCAAVAGRGWWAVDHVNPVYLDSSHFGTNVVRAECAGPMFLGRLVYNMTYRTYLAAVKDGVEDKSRSEVQEKIAAADAILESALGPVLDAQASLSFLVQLRGGSPKLMNRVLPHRVTNSHLTPSRKNSHYLGSHAGRVGVIVGPATGLVPLTFHPKERLLRTSLVQGTPHTSGPNDGYVTTSQYVVAPNGDYGINLASEACVFENEDFRFIDCPGAFGGVKMTRMVGPIHPSFYADSLSNWSLAGVAGWSFSAGDMDGYATTTHADGSALSSAEVAAAAANVSVNDPRTVLLLDQVSSHELDVVVMTNLWQAALNGDLTRQDVKDVFSMIGQQIENAAASAEQTGT